MRRRISSGRWTFLRPKNGGGSPPSGKASRHTELAASFPSDGALPFDRMLVDPRPVHMSWEWKVWRTERIVGPGSAAVAPDLGGEGPGAREGDPPVDQRRRRPGSGAVSFVEGLTTPRGRCAFRLPPRLAFRPYFRRSKCFWRTSGSIGGAPKGGRRGSVLAKSGCLSQLRLDIPWTGQGRRVQGFGAGAPLGDRAGLARGAEARPPERFGSIRGRPIAVRLQAPSWRGPFAGFPAHPNLRRVRHLPALVGWSGGRGGARRCRRTGSGAAGGRSASRP
jgi:hypothetical protein